MLSLIPSFQQGLFNQGVGRAHIEPASTLLFRNSNQFLETIQLLASYSWAMLESELLRRQKCDANNFEQNNNDWWALDFDISEIIHLLWCFQWKWKWPFVVAATPLLLPFSTLTRRRSEEGEETSSWSITFLFFSFAQTFSPIAFP